MLRKVENMIRISQIKVTLPHTQEELWKAAARTAKVSAEDIIEMKIIKKSLDARKKPSIMAVYTVDITLKSPNQEKNIIRHCKTNQITRIKEQPYEFPLGGPIPLSARPVIIGTGPAGLFCGLMLARAGYHPLLLERGQNVDDRTKAVEDFWKTGVLCNNSNVQFGEGGAGTFSDGKLNTLVKDVSGRNRKVLEEFVKAGANEEILYLNKPHIGTDELQKIVKNIRIEIAANGGEVCFESQVTDILIKNGMVTGVKVNDQKEINTQTIILAIGHSARDTFSMLKNIQVPMCAKPFAVGVRIEHPQKMINLSQYGTEQADYLPAADYKLTAKAASQRGIYSFCMCPGGYVVNASSEAGRLAVNGMSYSQRDGRNANSALIVTVDTKDFPSNDVLGGIEFQRLLEERAFLFGEGQVPVQLYEDFKNNQASKLFGEVEPAVKGDFRFGNVREIFPESISHALLEGIETFEYKIKGFARKDAVLSGVESRTSSPVRIMRNEQFESEIKGLYPCGEGAGYAGGITSAAMDGIKVAEAIAKKYRIVL